MEENLLEDIVMPNVVWTMSLGAMLTWTFLTTGARAADEQPAQPAGQSAQPAAAQPAAEPASPATPPATEKQKTLNATVVDAKASAAAGDSTVCTQGKNKRIVELTSTNPQTKLPCEVHYKKETEQPGSDQVLFKADFNVSYCESKAQAFVQKLSGMGWTCAKS